jgi:hypothetical protein
LRSPCRYDWQAFQQEMRRAFVVVCSSVKLIKQERANGYMDAPGGLFFPFCCHTKGASILTKPPMALDFKVNCSTSQKGPLTPSWRASGLGCLGLPDGFSSAGDPGAVLSSSSPVNMNMTWEHGEVVPCHFVRSMQGEKLSRGHSSTSVDLSIYGECCVASAFMLKWEAHATRGCWSWQESSELSAKSLVLIVEKGD